MMLPRYLLGAVLLRLSLALPALCSLIMAFDLGDQGRRLARGGLGWAPVLLAAAAGIIGWRVRGVGR